MSQLVDRFGVPDLNPRRLPPFQSLAHAIIHQQLSGASAGAILKRFNALFDGNSFPLPDEVIRLDVERLRAAGLSRPKANYIRDLAQKSLDGVVPTLRECDRLTDAELVDRLTSIKGVGRFTANCRYFGAVKRLDGAVRVDTMLVNDTEWPAIVAGVSHMGNVG